MNKIWGNVQPAVRKETKRVALYTTVGVLLMWSVYGSLHIFCPENILLDGTVFLGGIFGGAVAVLNFFQMGLTVQKVTASSHEEQARLLMRSSYSRRMMMQIFWVLLAAWAPCFHIIAGILPLFFPGIGIKLGGLLKKYSRTDCGNLL